MKLSLCYTRSAIFPTPQRRGLRVPEQDRPHPGRVHHHGHRGQGEGQGGRRHDQHGGHQGARPAGHEGPWMRMFLLMLFIGLVFRCWCLMWNSRRSPNLRTWRRNIFCVRIMVCCTKGVFFATNFKVAVKTLVKEIKMVGKEKKTSLFERWAWYGFNRISNKLQKLYFSGKYIIYFAILLL